MSAVAPIIVHQHPEEWTRTPEKACYWVAETTVDDGQVYAARSRYGAPLELARVLVAAGVPDAPMEVHSAGLRGHCSYRSLHAAALYTIEENTKHLRRVRYARVEAARERAQRRWVEGQKQRGSAPAGSADAPMPVSAQNPALPPPHIPAVEEAAE